jgi:hypothetical protein
LGVFENGGREARFFIGGGNAVASPILEKRVGASKPVPD